MTTSQEGTVAQQTSNPPAKVTPGKIAKKNQDKFITILKTDHNFDIVSKIIDHIGQIERAKKIKPIEKHRMLQNYYLTLLSYCLPKMKVVEDNTANSTGKGVTFNISIGKDDSSSKPKSAGRGKVSKSKRTGVSVSIPTQKNKDGSYSVSTNSDPD